MAEMIATAITLMALLFCSMVFVEADYLRAERRERKRVERIIDERVKKYWRHW